MKIGIVLPTNRPTNLIKWLHKLNSLPVLPNHLTIVLDNVSINEPALYEAVPRLQPASITVHHSPAKLGCVKATITGARLIKEHVDWAFFAADDDELLPASIIQAKKYAYHDVGFICGTSRWCWPDGVTYMHGTKPEAGLYAGSSLEKLLTDNSFRIPGESTCWNVPRFLTTLDAISASLDSYSIFYDYTLHLLLAMKHGFYKCDETFTQFNLNPAGVWATADNKHQAFLTVLSIFESQLTHDQLALVRRSGIAGWLALCELKSVPSNWRTFGFLRAFYTRRLEFICRRHLPPWLVNLLATIYT